MSYPIHSPLSPPLYNDLIKAITGEYEAIHIYKQLAEMATSQAIKDQILEIRQDEIRHFETFSQIFTMLTHTNPRLPTTISYPKSFQEGVKEAFKDEQETTDFYYQISRTYHDPMIKQAFSQAAADEQNHAVWFLYFMK